MKENVNAANSLTSCVRYTLKVTVQHGRARARRARARSLRGARPAAIPSTMNIVLTLFHSLYTKHNVRTMLILDAREAQCVHKVFLDAPVKHTLHIVLLEHPEVTLCAHC